MFDGLIYIFWTTESRFVLADSDCLPALLREIGHLPNRNRRFLS